MSGPRRNRRGAARAALTSALAALGLAAAPLVANAQDVVLPTGQLVSPAGAITPLAAFPTGLAVSPDGATILALAGRPVTATGTVSVIMVIDVATGHLKQALQVGDAFQSATFTRDGATAYVAGGGDGVVHVFTVGSGGVLRAGTDVATGCDYVTGIMLAADEKTIWVACPQAGRVLHLDLAGGAVLLQAAAPSPDQIGISPDRSHVYASNWKGNTISVIDARSGRAQEIVVGDHPGALSVLPDGTVVVADANDGTLEPAAVLAALNPPAPPRGLPGTMRSGSAAGALLLLAAALAAALALWRRRGPGPVGGGRAGVRRVLALGLGGVVLLALSAPASALAKPGGPHGPLSQVGDTPQYVDASTPAVFTDLAQVGGHGDAPNAIAMAGDGRLLVSLGADNAIAVLAPGIDPAVPWRLTGLIPTGWYPLVLATSPDGATLHAVTARGLGHSAAATSPVVDPDPAAVAVDSAYATVGTLESLPIPSGAGLAGDTATALRGIAKAPSQGLLALGRRGPIKHVIYVTRENKTYDADLGDLHPGPDAALTLFGQPNTPNLHALERQFTELHAFYYPGYASVTGHMWEDAGGVSDIYERVTGDGGGLSDSWHQASNYPASGLLVGQVYQAGLSVRTYNEELAQQSGLFPARLQASTRVFPNYDLHVSDTSREAGWETEFRQFEAHRCGGDLAAVYGASCALPALEYVYLGEDHTTVTDQPGYPTVEAQVADNDYATGKLIDTVSKSPDWSSTLVIVVEDDPQGTGDVVSAYHGFVALASPYVKRAFVSDTHYELASIVRAIDDILGLPPLTDYVAQARPMDDAFTLTADPAGYSVDGSGVTAFPFTPLAGTAPAADPAHGIFSFAQVDRLDPALAGRSTWLQLRGMTQEEWLRTHAHSSPRPAR